MVVEGGMGAKRGGRGKLVPEFLRGEVRVVDILSAVNVDDKLGVGVLLESIQDAGHLHRDTCAGFEGLRV
jgi:hypothetical protein